MKTIRTISALALVLAPLAGCTSADASGDRAIPAPVTRQYIVGIDISGSVTPTKLRAEKEVIDGLVARMTPGDRIILVETYRSGSDSAGQWQDSIPAQKVPGTMTGRDRRNVEQFRAVANTMTGSFFDGRGAAGKATSTDLFATLRQAADYARAANGRQTTIVLLSDMLQSTAEVNMERAGGIPSSGWTDALKREGRLPDLRNVCVYVVGADATTQQGARVRDFWRHYFDAAGATFRPENYRNMVADPAEIGCG